MMAAEAAALLPTTIPVFLPAVIGEPAVMVDGGYTIPTTIFVFFLSLNFFGAVRNYQIITIPPQHQSTIVKENGIVARPVLL